MNMGMTLRWQEPSFNPQGGGTSRREWPLPVKLLAMSNLPPAAKDVLDFWFGTGSDNTVIAQTQRKLWWSKDAAVDAGMRTRFGALVDAAAAGRHNDWAETPRGRLALILLFDQFTRNIHRDNAQAFACDAQALQLAQDLINTKADRKLRRIERVFCYLPLEHSESIEMQNRSVELFSALVSETPEHERDTFTGYADFAERHREIIARFGRFPHRNRILGRNSTPEELEFLQQPGSSF
jgi:uncharacterized protein (DUF924 family)